MEFGEMSGNGGVEGVEMDAGNRRQVQFDDRGTPRPRTNLMAPIDNGFRPDVRPPQSAGLLHHTTSVVADRARETGGEAANRGVDAKSHRGGAQGAARTPTQAQARQGHLPQPDLPGRALLLRPGDTLLVRLQHLLHALHLPRLVYVHVAVLPGAAASHVQILTVGAIRGLCTV